MPTYQAQAGQKVTIDPGDPRGPWIIELPSGALNGDTVTIKAKNDDDTPVTVRATGAGHVLEDPLDHTYDKSEIVGVLRDLASLAYTFDSSEDAWRIYSTAIFTSYGVGSMRLAAPTAGSDIVGAFQPIDVFDTVTVPGIGCSFQLPDAFTIHGRGVWMMALTLFIQHDDSNQGRTFELRLFNITDGTVIQTVTIGVGRNTDATNITLVVPIPVDVNLDEDQFRWEVGNASATISSVIYDAAVFSLSQT